MYSRLEFSVLFSSCYDYCLWWRFISRININHQTFVSINIITSDFVIQYMARCSCSKSALHYNETWRYVKKRSLEKKLERSCALFVANLSETGTTHQYTWKISTFQGPMSISVTSATKCLNPCRSGGIIGNIGIQKQGTRKEMSSEMILYFQDNDP